MAKVDLREFQERYGGVRESERAYERWSQKPVDEILDVAVNFPRAVRSLGHLIRTIYRSDKWEKKGKYYDYVHFHGWKLSEKQVEKLVERGEPVPEDLLDTFPQVWGAEGRAGDPMPIEDVIGCDRNGSAALPWMAEIRSLVYQRGSKYNTISYSRPRPDLAHTLDNRVIVVADPKKPLFLFGARMVVTPEGIKY